MSYLLIFKIPLFISFLFPFFHGSHAVLLGQQSFIQCLANTSFPSNLMFTQTNNNYTAVLFSSIQNRRTLSSSHKPLLILTPTQQSHVQSVVRCSNKLNLLLRVRSGGHDYEGLSYSTTKSSPFIIIDLQKFRSITIDGSRNTAWVQAGATLGELYYAVAMKSRVAAFPAGSCPTIGVGGHFSGGGIGTIVRAYGLSIDNIVDARIVNVNGDVVDRKSMGEDLFWALRGGGGASFGVILSYKIKLVQVPPKVTVFNIPKRLQIADATILVNKFQKIAYKLDKRLFLYVVLGAGNNALQITFSTVFLGEKTELLSLIEQSFPELLLNEKDCFEMSWIQSVLHNAGHSPSSPLNVLLNRRPWSNSTSSFKDKSDFLTALISEEGWKDIFEWLLHENERPVMIIEPMGGKIDEISETETPFPHRKGSLYNLQYIDEWKEEGVEDTQKHLEWMRRFYEFMTPYVSSNPRGVYLNYRDLDLGVNEEGNTSYMKARLWGDRYFKGNFKRLAQVKSKVDPTNFFRNEQSIPLLF